MFYVQTDCSKQNKTYLKMEKGSRKRWAALNLMALTIFAALILLMEVLLSFWNFPFYIFVLRLAARMPCIAWLSQCKVLLWKQQHRRVRSLWIGWLAERIFVVFWDGPVSRLISVQVFVATNVHAVPWRLWASRAPQTVVFIIDGSQISLLSWNSTVYFYIRLHCGSD